MGDVGLAAAGLRWLESGRSARPLDAASRRAVAACVAAWRRPRALVPEGGRLVGRARAAVDVSDGLASDAGRIAEASGIRIVLEEIALCRVLRPELVRACGLLGAHELRVALGGGEDYALIATGPAAARPGCARRIGRVEAGSGVRLESSSGRLQAVTSGFDHFTPERR